MGVRRRTPAYQADASSLVFVGGSWSGLLISGSKVRVLDGPPTLTGTSRTPEVPADFQSAGLGSATRKTQESARGSKQRGNLVDLASPRRFGQYVGQRAPEADGITPRQSPQSALKMCAAGNSRLPACVPLIYPAASSGTRTSTGIAAEGGGLWKSRSRTSRRPPRWTARSTRFLSRPRPSCSARRRSSRSGPASGDCRSSCERSWSYETSKSFRTGPSRPSSIDRSGPSCPGSIEDETCSGRISSSRDDRVGR